MRTWKVAPELSAFGQRLDRSRAKQQNFVDDGALRGFALAFQLGHKSCRCCSCAGEAVGSLAGAACGLGVGGVSVSLVFLGMGISACRTGRVLALAACSFSFGLVAGVVRSGDESLWILSQLSL
jgi:hypothetical protein